MSEAEQRVEDGAAEFWAEGVRYHDVCLRAWPAKPVFTPEIIYQMSAMAMEKMFMAWMTEQSALPENHTLRDLVRAADKIEALPIELRKDLLRMDRFMDLCPLVPMNLPKPQEADVPSFLSVMGECRVWLEPRVKVAETQLR